jgi:membrane protease YdiL (CAAX protease family)
LPIMAEMNSPAIENPGTGKRVWGFWATVGFGAVVMIVSFFIQTLVALAFIIIGLFTLPVPSSSPPRFGELYRAILESFGAYEGMAAAISTVASAIICGILIFAIIKARRGASFSEYLGFRRISLKSVLVMLAVTAGFLALSAVLVELMKIPEDSDFIVGIYSTSVSPVLLWAALVVFAPFFEEALFRGFLFEGFRQSRIGVIGAIILTALLWALSHVQYNYYGIVTILVLGIILGVVRQKTGSLFGPMLIHAVNNAAALLLLMVQLNGPMG